MENVISKPSLWKLSKLKSGDTWELVQSGDEPPPPHWALGLKEVALQVQEQNQVILYEMCLNNLNMFHG